MTIGSRGSQRSRAKMQPEEGKGDDDRGFSDLWPLESWTEVLSQLEDLEAGKEGAHANFLLLKQPQLGRKQPRLKGVAKT